MCKGKLNPLALLFLRILGMMESITLRKDPSIMFLNSLIGSGKDSRKKVQTLDFNQMVYGVLSAEALLSAKTIQTALEELPSIINLSPEYYKSLYEDLLSNFAHFVQILPTENKTGIASILINGISRSCYVIKVHKEQTDDPHNHMKNYVIFSATLMMEVGKVIDDRQVTVCNREGECLSPWNPFEGPMTNWGQYFKLREVGGMPKRYFQSINALLARQLMPSMGFNWIAEHPRMFHVWLALLGGTIPEMDGLSYITEVVKKWHALDLENQGFHYPNVLESQPSEGTALGEALLAWIKAQLAGNLLTVNEFDSMFQMTEQGLFVQTPAVFDAFIKDQQTAGAIIDRVSLEEQFAKLGVSRQVGDQPYVKFQITKPASVTGRSAGVFGSAPSSARQKSRAGGSNLREGIVLNQNLVYGPSNPNIPPNNPLVRAVGVASANVISALNLPRSGGARQAPPLFPGFDSTAS